MISLRSPVVGRQENDTLANDNTQVKINLYSIENTMSLTKYNLIFTPKKA